MVSDVQLPGVEPPDSTRVRRSARAQERRRKRRRTRSRVAVLVSLAILVAAGGAVWFGLKPIVASLTEPSDYPGPGSGVVQVQVPDGATGREIGRILAAKGVVKSAKAFADAAGRTPKAASIRPGSYDMRLKMSSAGAIALLADPKNRVFVKFTVPEGKRVTEIIEIIAKKGIPKKDLQAAMKDPAALGVPDWAKGTKAGVKFPLEGFLFPSTYEIEPGDTASSLLSKMVRRTLDELTAAGVPAGKEWKVLTEASIIQAEGGSSEDYPKIARVFENRTAKGMKFELDSTVSYATQRFGVTTTSKERASTSPYNTYHVKGLPVGPICNPGAETIEAALAPATGAWLYWVTVNPDTKETKFAVTSAEHERNVLEFQKWLRDNPQKG